MVTARDEAVLARARLFRDQGVETTAHRRHVAKAVQHDTYVVAGYNYRMTDVAAAIGRVQLRRLPDIVARRRELAQRYRTLLADVPHVGLPWEPTWARSNWQSFVVRLPRTPRRRTVMQALLDRGIATRRGVMCVHREPAYPSGTWRCAGPADCGCPPATCRALAHSELAQDRGLILPLSDDMTDDDQRRVVAALADACAPESFDSQVRRRAARSGLGAE